MSRLRQHARLVHGLEAVLLIAVAAAFLVDRWRGGMQTAAPAATSAPAPAARVPERVPAVASGTANRTAAAASPDAAASQAALAALRDRFARSSLRGTRRDGDYTLGPDGRLVLDAALVRAFDYWLTLSGELTDAEVRTLLLADARATHGAALATQVEAAFERYLGLRSQLAATASSDDLAIRLDRLRAARRAWFGADAEAMFGAEEAAIAHTLERQRLETADLPLAERRAALEALERTRPAATRAAQLEASAALVADQQARQSDASNATPAQRQAEREALWGREAAQRLARLDAERADWDRRVGDYLRDRAGLSPAQAAALRGTRFSPAERARIEALEAIGALEARAPGG